MNKEQLIDRHAQTLKSWVGTGLAKDECIGLIKNAVDEALFLYGVGNWVRFEDEKPKLNDRYLLVWDNYPPETRTWQKEDEDRDFTGLRWLAIPKWK